MPVASPGAVDEGAHSKDNIRISLCELVRKDPICCDLQWSLFVAAAKSYRFSSILQPFPAMYLFENSEEKNIFILRNDLACVPSMMDVPSVISSLPDTCVNLMLWLLKSSTLKIELREKDSTMKMVRELTGQITPAPEPHFVFEVIPSEEQQEKFQNLQGSKKTFHAFHGSRLDNFYSILHNGLNTRINKVSVFGEGTYLSSELSLSLMYSQAGEGWKHSALSSRLSCVAVCQMIDDPSVKCQIKDGSVSQQRQRAQASRMTDSVPEKYYVVQNDAMIRVRYILVYKTDTAQPLRNQRSYASWLREYKFPLLMLAYILLLVAIGIANSRQAVNALGRFYKRLKLF